MPPNPLTVGYRIIRSLVYCVCFIASAATFHDTCFRFRELKDTFSQLLWFKHLGNNLSQNTLDPWIIAKLFTTTTMITFKGPLSILGCKGNVVHG